MFERNLWDFGFTKHGEQTTECGICGFFSFCWAFLWLITLTLNLRLFYGSLRSFFAWLGFLCVELAFCGTAFARLTARLLLTFLGFLTRCFLGSTFALCVKSGVLGFGILRIFGICDEF